MTVELHAAELFDVSVAVQLKAVLPIGKTEPAGGVQPFDWIAQLSVALSIRLDTTAPEGIVHLSVGLKQVITGGSLSLTMMLALHEFFWPF